MTVTRCWTFSAPLFFLISYTHFILTRKVSFRVFLHLLIWNMKSVYCLLKITAACSGERYSCWIDMTCVRGSLSYQQSLSVLSRGTWSSRLGRISTGLPLFRLGGIQRNHKVFKRGNCKNVICPSIHPAHRQAAWLKSSDHHLSISSLL